MELPDFCVIDENIWLLGLNECNRFKEKCPDAKNALLLFKNCKHKIKLIINMNYQQEIINKLQEHYNQNRDSYSVARLRYISSIITIDIDRFEWIKDFNIHSPDLEEYYQFMGRSPNNIKLDDYFLVKFYQQKDKCVLISEDQEILQLKNNNFDVCDSKEVCNRYQIANCMP